MISIRDIFALAKVLNKNHIKSIRDYDSISFDSDSCKDHELLLEYGGVVYEDKEHCHPKLFPGWNVFVKKSESHIFYKLPDNYKEDWSELAEDGWHISDKARSALMEVIADIRHNSEAALNQLEECFTNSAPESVSLKLYRVDVYETLTSHAWLWATDPNDAYVKGRSFENTGRLVGKDFINSDLEVEEEPEPDDVLSSWILNSEEKDDV